MKRILTIMVALMMCFVMSVPESAFAVSNSKVLHSYADFLAKHKAKNYDQFFDAAFEPKDKSYVNYFTTIDIDKDGKEELLTYTTINFRWQIIRIYRYKNGKVRPYKFSSGKNAVFEQCAIANGTYTLQVCKDHIHNVWIGGYGSKQNIYEVSNGKLKLYLTREEDTLIGDGVPISKEYGKKISEVEFEETIEWCEEYGLSCVDWTKNNKANRNKLR